MSLILLRLSNGSRVLDRPRDFRSYDGRGASKALMLAIERTGAALSAASDQGKPTIELHERSMRLHNMALSQIEREQAREREAAE